MARPSKLTPEVQATIAEAILYGCTYRDAAESAGVDYNTFNEWRKAGEIAKSGKFYEFNEAVTKANAECAKNMTRVIQTAAAKGEWKAALEWLKRRRRDEWGDSASLDLSNSDGSLKPEKGIDDATFERAITTLTATLREVIPATDSGQNSDMGSAK